MDADGAPLAIQDQSWRFDGSGNDSGSETIGTKWTCVKDHITELTWEVKTSSSLAGLRDKYWSYTWFNSNPYTNAGDPGFPDTGVGVGSDNCLNTSRCDTEKFVADVNAATLCGVDPTFAWRLPNLRELLTLVHAGTQVPSIDTTYFPNTVVSSFWSGSSFVQVPNTDYAWFVYFAAGVTHGGLKSGDGFVVRLVRGGQF